MGAGSSNSVSVVDRVNSFVTNNVVNTTSNCTSTNTANSTININDISGCSIKISGVNSTAQIKSDFTCLQSKDMQEKLQQKLDESFKQYLTQDTKADALGLALSDSYMEQKIQNTINSTSTITDLSNCIAENVANATVNMKNLKASDCATIASTVASMSPETLEILAPNVKDWGSISIENISAIALIDSVSKCTNNVSSIKNLVSDIKTITDTATTQTTTAGIDLAALVSSLTGPLIAGIVMFFLVFILLIAGFAYIFSGSSDDVKGKLARHAGNYMTKSKKSPDLETSFGFKLNNKINYFSYFNYILLFILFCITVYFIAKKYDNFSNVNTIIITEVVPGALGTYQVTILG